MLIQGIRSFGPEESDSQRIKFHSPLTLILGQNGCGKTTIIECLKYAITGDLPPGAKLGQSFVHDPKLSRRIETNAKIMLQFLNQRNDTVLVTRLMQLTQMPKTLKFGTKDSTLTVVKTNGERADINGRCADINVEVCTALGVSGSILNNVIFCHQEDSAWPLDESKKVKEKFDDIFDATKYNKYLETIRLKRKSILDDTKSFDKDMEYLTKIREEVNAKKQKLEDAERRMTVNTDQINSYERKLEPITERLKFIHSREVDYTKLYTEKEKRKTELEGIKNNQRELSSSIKVKFSGSKYDLEEEIQKFQTKMKEKQNLLDESKSKLHRLEKEDYKLQDEITREKVEKGKLQAELKQQEERIDARNKQLGRLAGDLEIQTVSYTCTQLTEDEVTNTISKIGKKMKQLESALEAMRSQFEIEEQTMQKKIDEQRDEKVALEQQVNLKSKQIIDTRTEARKIKNEIEEINLSANKLQRIEDKLKRTIRDLEEVEKSVNVTELNSEIETLIDKRSCLREQLEEVEREVKILQQQSSIQAELDIQLDSKSLKETEIRKLKNKHEDTLKDLLKDVPEEGIKYELKLCIDRLAQEIKDMNASLRSKQHELATLEANRKHQRDTLRKKEDELRGKEELIYEACGDQEYNEIVKKLQENLEHLQDTKGTLSSSEYMFKSYIQKLQQPNPCCPLCHRGFDLISDAQELNTEIPKLKTDLEQTEKKIGTLRRDVENLEYGLAEPQANKERAEKIQPDIVLFDQHHKEDQMRSELNEAQHSLENAQQKLSNHKERIQKLKEDKNKLTEEKLKAESGIQKLRQLEEKQSELQGLEVVLSEEVETLREKLSIAARHFQTATKEKEAIKNQNKEKLKKEEKEITNYQKKVDEINRYQSNIREFEKKGVDKRLDDLQLSLQEVEQKKDSMTKSIQDIKVKIGDITNELSQQQVKKRELDDNLKLYVKEEEAKAIKIEIEKLKQNLGDFKFDNLLKEKNDLKKQQEKIERDKAQSEGMLKEQQSTILSLRNELKKPIYKDNEKKYIDAVIKQKVGKAAAEDLNHYYKATEWAMFHFHQERMKEINTIIRELWRQIYRGNDIDYIEIKSDIPETSTSDKRRNYNYRVVQMKNDVEIDMRGRCSAGQKVLASLIIRMALAETFSANCGILALDEPTTNLDRENIESLSTALADIVNSRLVQKNFQLVIITHDEEFLDRLSKVEKLEYYYRVSRNDHGKSVINKYRVDR
ncbi:hypothetical protein L9F63_002432 [Diploptera punctata]|uniref:DNA repair protein RAD50 n=1 Tax=Diploptera punctata TaxID=6984 RepID=A0AAD7ZSH8_DIPPU|nr:hypothetical protein L9F63_002432 [Diploptera punctata]